MIAGQELSRSYWADIATTVQGLKSARTTARDLSEVCRPYMRKVWLARADSYTVMIADLISVPELNSVLTVRGHAVIQPASASR